MVPSLKHRSKRVGLVGSDVGCLALGWIFEVDLKRVTVLGYYTHQPNGQFYDMLRSRVRKSGKPEGVTTSINSEFFHEDEISFEVSRDALKTGAVVVTEGLHNLW